jgi:Rod binding domain-containing protein
MNSINLQSLAAANPTTLAKMPTAPSANAADNPALRKAFDQFVGQTFYGQMLQSMRKSQSKSAYFNGGRAEEVFTQQLDTALTKKLSETSASKLSGPMYNLFTQQRK